MRVALCATALLCLSTSAFAEPVEQVVPAARMLPESTAIQVANDAEISSKKVNVGDRFSFTVVNDVVENGVVAIPRGSKVEAAVTFKTGKAIGGKSGKFELNFDKLALRGNSYTIRGTHRQEGKGNTVAAVFGSMLVSGRSAVMVPGQVVSVYTAQPIPY
ncbi:hypothetical protein [Novosphingobium colocasiae]|uniref:hypothetical protein n=1 Tax=Novosphingobium colocasiae TaxID=1256513 RepID=UPI0035AE93F3